MKLSLYLGFRMILGGLAGVDAVDCIGDAKRNKRIAVEWVGLGISDRPCCGTGSSILQIVCA